MSHATRQLIGYWFALILGISILAFQFYKYFSNQLELNATESIVFVVGFVLIFKPNGILRFIDSKYGGKNAQ